MNRYQWLALFAGLCLAGVMAGAESEISSASRFGHFDPARDLLLAQFDSKTDVDDVHSIAGVATLLADPRFSDVNYHAVAGAYGIQEGLYVPSNALFELAFGSRWSNAHENYAKALEEVSVLANQVLKIGGDIWIAEAGQSNFSADLARSIAAQMPEVDLSQRFHIVQHSDWNESVTRPEDLEYVKQKTDYHRIPDGNALYNGTPGFKTADWIGWDGYVKDARLTAIWELAVQIANQYNGAEGRYLNTAIQAGGMDFSDVVETCWIFGYQDLLDAEAFFKEFGQ